jgi:hypothetical protein
MSLKVGKDLMPGTQNKVTYKDVKRNKRGWVESNQFIPRDYDLVMIRFSTGKITYGWTRGRIWEGVLVTPDVIVEQWKRKISEEFP